MQQDLAGLQVPPHGPSKGSSEKRTQFLLCRSQHPLISSSTENLEENDKVDVHGLFKLIIFIEIER